MLVKNDTSASNNNILVDSTVTVYPIHTDCKEEWLGHTVSLGSNPTLNGYDLVREHGSLQYCPVSNHPDFL